MDTAWGTGLALSPVSPSISYSLCGKASQAVARLGLSLDPLHIFSPTSKDAGVPGLVRSGDAGSHGRTSEPGIFGMMDLDRCGGAGSHGGISAKSCHCCVPYCEVGGAVCAAGSWDIEAKVLALPRLHRARNLWGG